MNSPTEGEQVASQHTSMNPLLRNPKKFALGEMRRLHFKLAQTIGARTLEIPEGRSRAVILSFDVETLDTSSRSQEEHEAFLPRLVELLGEYGFKANFFVCARSMELYPESITTIIHKGHGLGGHGWMHEAMPEFSYASQCAIINKVRSISKEYAGTAIRSWRSPYLRSSIWTYLALAERGFNISSSTKAAKKPIRIGGMTELPLAVMDGDILGYHETRSHQQWTDFMKRSLSEPANGVAVYGMHTALQMGYDPRMEGLSEVLSSLEESASDTWVGTLESLLRGSSSGPG